MGDTWRHAEVEHHVYTTQSVNRTSSGRQDRAISLDCAPAHAGSVPTWTGTGCSLSPDISARPGIGSLKRAASARATWVSGGTPPSRRLSPSDFGFHNALVGPDGRLVFLDFEYAGWDDPAKLIADFFCQPAVPAPLGECDRFVRTIGGELHDDGACARRLAVLWPVYQIKWVCIILNEFLPIGGARRRFARSGAEAAERKTMQLHKARHRLDALRTSVPVAS